MSTRTSFYQQRVTSLQTQQSLIDRKLRTISRIRVALFLALVASAALAIFINSLFAWAIIPIFIAFGFQVKRYSKEFNEAEICQRVLQLNENELAFTNGDKSVFPHESVDAEGHIYATDLDIFGKGSLFQAIDRTSTWEGRGLLANALLSLPKDIATINDLKAVTTELSESIDWRQRFYAIGTMAGESPKDMPSLRQWVDQQDFFLKRGSWIWIARIISAISLLFIGWMIYVQQFYVFYFMGWATINLAIRGIFFEKDLKVYFASLGYRTRLFKKFSDLFDLVSKRPFTSRRGKDHHSKVREASSAFLELSQLSNRAEQRLNGLVGPLMNGLFLFDIWNVHAIERWRARYKTHVDGWIIALANIDMLSSLANYRFNHPEFNDANVVTG
ncbi:MAG TPA: hypothetical protein VFE50_07390, partial [Cyclobacteriaceae bacterium]|nr:hypothetical protein [Cyclobacteriaceae bacterium]